MQWRPRRKIGRIERLGGRKGWLGLLQEGVVRGDWNRPCTIDNGKEVVLVRGHAACVIVGNRTVERLACPRAKLKGTLLIESCWSVTRREMIWICHVRWGV